MNKKAYSSPEVKFVTFEFSETVAASSCSFTSANTDISGGCSRA